MPDKCSKCGWVDKKDMGDWSYMVARCSGCQEMVCGECWDKYHAETCSDG